jgi:hypothetical protein
MCNDAVVLLLLRVRVAIRKVKPGFEQILLIKMVMAIREVNNQQRILTNMSSGLHLLAAVGILFAVCLGQDLNPSACVGSITSFPNCDNVNAILQRCNQLTAKQDIINCFCTQDLINAYVG